MPHDIAPSIERRHQRGMARRYPPITAVTTTALAASLRLFGEPEPKPGEYDHRGIYLRYVLRKLYGADYRARGCKLLGVGQPRLSAMMSGGERVSRAIVQRLEHALPNRERNRQKELRRLALAIEAAFSAERAEQGELAAIVAAMARAASVAANTRQPHSVETGRFVPRDQAKTPTLREPGAAVKKRAREKINPG